MTLKRTGNLITVFLIAMLVAAFSITQCANAASMAYCLDKESEPTEDKVVKYTWDDPVDAAEGEETEAEAKAEAETALLAALKANGFEGKEDDITAVRDLLVKVLYYGHPQTKNFTKEETGKAVWWVVKNANTFTEKLSDSQKKDENYNALCEKAFKGDMPKKWQLYVYASQPEEAEGKILYYAEGEFDNVGVFSSRNPATLSGKQTVKEATPVKPLTESNTGTYNSRNNSGSQSTSTTNTSNTVSPNSSNSTTTNSTDSNTTNQGTTTRTGDDAMLSLILLIAITSLGLVIACLLRRRNFGK